jgi:hypothetical protein
MRSSLTWRLLTSRQHGACFVCAPQGSVVQRLQRFATYSHLKQVVLRMITEEMRSRGKAPSFGAALQVCVVFWGGGKGGPHVLTGAHLNEAQTCRGGGCEGPGIGVGWVCVCVCGRGGGVAVTTGEVHSRAKHPVWCAMQVCVS